MCTVRMQSVNFLKECRLIDCTGFKLSLFKVRILLVNASGQSELDLKYLGTKGLLQSAHKIKPAQRSLLFTFTEHNAIIII